ncbi:unknown similar to AMEV080 [Choristoneura rosaceana entomopoxvirus 'L']|uniref:Uncharacterized protein n=2 Tax=Betaentomopoxvirus TaxID=10286 RepID=A0A916KPZ7_CBEPV|nr:unknown similar to AMEV080 [Choristoneura biennis entomopoxvirus]YP_008004509.1 unknown similar to AMEV080 [Choristoneura rosaceana entomopoxvirus 'L']CCU55705.1 unknown similar to AMEV080 [Choristoneura biennis entomopoxvirus]CCU56007.1 unknown similar to AMEV080 [Choristoneura rosaceana entomopoxvirus 'L']
MLLFFITLIILTVIIIIIYYIIINTPSSIDSLNNFDDEYLANIRFVPEQIFDYSIGDYNDLIQQLEELRIRHDMLYNEYNDLKNERNIYLNLIEDQNDHIMNLRNHIDTLKAEIANNTNNLSNING